ncbi:MAG: 1-acyl-sn-glycerol-3-phosphate acyltransferase [Neomegalonema sp.]|nr:1-acyl-sn-glycerol-3-phosphate acyltransferase [Neomegalonema sp.]
MSQVDAAETGAAGQKSEDASGDAKLSYNPGWSDSTWIGGDPEPRPTPTALQHARGVFRLAAFALSTLALLPLFFIARAIGERRDRYIAAMWCASGVRLCGLKIRQVGEPISGGALLVNHASWIDILLIGARAPVHFVAKAEVSGWPIFGWIGRISNTVFIARKRAEAKAQEQLLAGRARGGDLLCLFPEGTSSDGMRVLPFKSSLFSLFFVKDVEAGEGAAEERPMLAQPVSIHFAPRSGLPKSFYGWWGKMDLFGHIMAICKLGGGVATLHFHPPLNPADFPNRKALAAEAERKVREGLEAAAKRASETA